MAEKDNLSRSVVLEINLLPLEFRSTKTDLTWLADRRIVYPTIGTLVGVFLLFMAWIHINDTITGLTSELDEIKASIQRDRPLLTKIKELDEKLTIIAQKNKALMSIQVSKKRWVILFENISSVLPANMWLIQVGQIGTDQLELRGVTYDFSEIAEYMVKLEQQISMTNVTLVSITTSKTGGENSYSFTIKCTINQELGLESAK